MLSTIIATHVLKKIPTAAWDAGEQIKDIVCSFPFLFVIPRDPIRRMSIAECHVRVRLSIRLNCRVHVDRQYDKQLSFESEISKRSLNFGYIEGYLVIIGVPMIRIYEKSRHDHLRSRLQNFYKQYIRTTSKLIRMYYSTPEYLDFMKSKQKSPIWQKKWG